jgi:hypothetical protein
MEGMGIVFALEHCPICIADDRKSMTADPGVLERLSGTVVGDLAGSTTPRNGWAHFPRADTLLAQQEIACFAVLR